MTAVLSGTNGLIQSYGYIDNTTTPVAATNGFNYTFTPSSTGTVLVINPAGTLATGIITMPASPVDGMTITFSSSQQITALTMMGNGANINNAVTLLPAKTAVTYVYRATGTTWWPMQSVPGTGSQLVSGTAVASTSGTNIDFTGIPSWVKRITVMFNGVSTSGTSNLYLQIGTSSGVETSGYVSGIGSSTSAGSAGYASATTAFILVGINTITDTQNGFVVLTNVSGNIWTEMGALNRASGGTSAVATSAGSKTLAAVLDRVRITTAGGDTFDAGSINILYE